MGIRSLNPCSNGMRIEPIMLESAPIGVQRLNPCSNGMRIEQSYLSVFWKNSSSVTLVHPFIAQPLRHSCPKISQMSPYCDVKCWKFLRSKLPLRCLSAKCESKKVRKWLAGTSEIVLLRKTVSRNRHFIVCKSTHFSQMSQAFSPKNTFANYLRAAQNRKKR